MGAEAAVNILPVTEENLDAAARVHALSWQASHREICAPEFVAVHTEQRQRDYLRRKLQTGSRIFLLTEDIPAGIVSVRENLIEDLYVLPEWQGRGCGTALLQHAARECGGMPTLWLLETNLRARGFYEHHGFRPTGAVNHEHGPLAEIEFALTTEKNPCAG